MALKLAGEEVGIQEKIEVLTYAPGLQDSGDLEAATRTVTATEQQVTPDYSTGLTISVPPDGRLVVTRVCLRIQLTLDSLNGGATKLCCRWKRNGVSIDYWEMVAPGQRTEAHDITGGDLTGAATYELFLWVDQGNAVVSQVQFWAAVGTKGQYAADILNCITLGFSGQAAVILEIRRAGTGTPYGMLCPKEAPYALFNFGDISGEYSRLKLPHIVISRGDTIATYGTVLSDINYVNRLHINLGRLL